MISLPTARATRPPNFSLSPQGGITIIPRRGFFGGYAGGVWSGPLANKELLFQYAAAMPMRLSEILGTYHPTYSKAQSNWITATCEDVDVKLTAYTRTGDGQDTPDDAATAEIDTFFSSLGSGIGGLVGLRTKGAQSVLHYGLWALEAVPGPRNKGVASIGLVDPITIEFGEDNVTGRTIPFQYQVNVSSTRKQLSEETFFWYSHHASVNNPYGVGVFSAAVAEALKEIHFDKDISDSVHNAAWQRYVYKYSKETLWKIAVSPKELGGLGLPTNDVERNPDGSPTNSGKFVNPAEIWVNAELAAIQSYLAGLNPDDNIVADASGGVETLPAASFQGLTSVIEHKDYRLIRALDELPTTMGTPKSGAQTYTTAEWATQASKQEAMRASIMEPILKIVNLHFRLQGRPIIVKAQYIPIRKSDAVNDANAEATKLKTRKERWMLGLITKEQLAIEETGSGLPENDPDAYTGPDPEQDENRDTDQQSENAPLPQDGTSQEEQDANK